MDSLDRNPGTDTVCALRAAIKSVCSEYRIHNADVYMKEDCDVDDLVDVIEGSRVYIPCIYVINKIDQVRTPSPAPAAPACSTCSLQLQAAMHKHGAWQGIQTQQDSPGRAYCVT